MITLDEKEDSLLLERIHDGQLHSKSLLIKRYRPYILRLVKQMAGPEEVEDLTQEILMKMLMHIRKFEQRSSLKTWLYRITLNHVIQKRTHRNNSLAELNRHRHLPDEHNCENQCELERNVLMGLALGMDESQRIPIVLTDIFRLSAKQASQHLSISEVSYRKRLSRSRAELKKWMRRNHLKPNTAVHDPEKIAKATLLINACEGSLIDHDHEATLPSFP